MGIKASLIADRVAEVQMRIDKAARRAGRDPNDVMLVAVTKTHPLELVQAACEAGLRHFGENRVEEAQIKIMSARGVLPEDVNWHMIGHIQSRKSADVAALFGWVHSVDRLKVARKLGDSAGQEGRVLEVLLEVNLSGEEGKYGYNLSRWPDDPAQGEQFCAEAHAVAEVVGLRVQGLMTMAPYTENAEEARPFFRRLALLRDLLRRCVSECEWRHLSMGMSGDYEMAIEEGATIVRIGTALFGPRRPQT